MIDTNGCLVGMITVDDVIDVVYEEVEEDIMHLAGVPEPDFYAPIFFPRVWRGFNGWASR